jgi:hypothetical protein
MGLEVAALVSCNVVPELEVYGRVLDPVALALPVADLISARADAAAAQKEFARLETLRFENNVSERALELAGVEARRGVAAVEKAHACVLGLSNGRIADLPDLQSFLSGLLSGNQALVRVELPQGQSLPAEPSMARVISMVNGEAAVSTTCLGRTLGVDPQIQSEAFLFLVATNAGAFPAGAAVRGFVDLGGDPRPGVVMPSAAVVRHNGAAWAYIQDEENTFERRIMVLGREMAGGWLLEGGAAVGERVVTVGAQQLLSEELKGQAVEE